MGRLKALSAALMTAEQREATETLVARGGRVGGPYSALVRIPQFMLLHNQMGDYLRDSSLGERLRKIIVLVTVRHWGAEYAWAVNVRSAIKDGMEQAVIDAISQGRDPGFLEAKEIAVYRVARELLESRDLSQPTYDLALSALGETSLADAVATAGFYSLVSMSLVAFKVDPPKT